MTPKKTKLELKREKQIEKAYRQTLSQYHSFDWDDLKDLKSNPYNFVNSNIFWFQVNASYFPFKRNIELYQDPAKFLTQIRQMTSLETIQSQNLKCDESRYNLYQRIIHEFSLRTQNEQASDFHEKLFNNGQNNKISDVDRLLQFMSVELIRTENEIGTQFNDLEISVNKSYHRSINGNSIFDSQDFILKLFDNEDDSLDEESKNMKIPHQRIKDYIKYSEEKFNRQRELEFWQKKNEILKQTRTLVSSPIKPQINLITSSFRKIMPKAISTIKEEQKLQSPQVESNGDEQQENSGCVICCGEDYEDDNLIVYCEVHQVCYGLEVIPEGDFICQTCSVFEEDSHLVQCSLCSLKGGVMRPTQTKTSERIGDDKKDKKDQNQQQKSITSYLKKEKDLYKKNKTLKNEGILPQDFWNTYYQWVHLSCVFWNIELILPQKAPIKLIKQSEKRLSLVCVICQKKGVGVCIQCSYKSCHVSFHVECARKAKYYMNYDCDTESKEVFCLSHRPFPLIQEIEKNEKQIFDEIMTFSESFEQSLADFKQLKKWSDRDRRELLQNCRKVYFYMRKLKCTIYKQPQQLPENLESLNDSGYYIKEGRFFDRPKDWTVLQQIKGAFPWKSVMFKNYNRRDCFRMFNELIQSEDSFIKKVVTEKYINLYNEVKKRLQKAQQKEKIRQDKIFQKKRQQQMKNKIKLVKRSTPLCYCRKPVIKIENGILCSRGREKCFQGGVIHKACIRKYDSRNTYFEGQKWYCKKCIEYLRFKQIQKAQSQQDLVGSKRKKLDQSHSKYSTTKRSNSQKYYSSNKDPLTNVNTSENQTCEQSTSFQSNNIMSDQFQLSATYVPMQSQSQNYTFQSNVNSQSHSQNTLDIVKDQNLTKISDLGASQQIFKNSKQQQDSMKTEIFALQEESSCQNEHENYIIKAIFR
eukprot:403356329